MNTVGVARPGIAHRDVRATESGRTLKKAVDRTAIYRASADVLAGGWYNFYGRQGDSETANQRLAKIYASSTTVAARGIQIHVGYNKYIDKYVIWVSLPLILLYGQSITAIV